MEVEIASKNNLSSRTVAQLGGDIVILLPRRHLALVGDILGCPDREQASYAASSDAQVSPT